MQTGPQAISAGVAAQSLLINPRALAGFAALLVAGLLLLLYFYRRRVYILYWCGGWTLTAASMLVAAAQYSRLQLGWMAYGLSQFLGIVAALVFVVSADAYRSTPRLRRAYALVVMPLLIWFALAPVALGPAAVFAPGHLLIGGALAAAGIAHLALLRETRLLGAALCGAMLIATGAAHLWIAYSIPKPDADAAARVMFLITVLFILTALGMQLMTFEDMTYELRATNRRLEAAQGELRQMVTTDPLTGCRNRRYFDDIIRREVQRHRRYRIPLSILFIDVDKFKVVNDTLGHEAGDKVLQLVAGFLVRNVREADYVFRWGGDEFVVLISCHEAQAQRKGADLRAAFASSPDTAGLPRGVGLSVGCVEVPPEIDDVMALVSAADERMYASKPKTLRE